MCDDNQIKNIRVSTQPVLGPGTQITHKTIVTYNVGEHGPFRHEYDSGTVDVGQIQNDIQDTANFVNDVKNIRFIGPPVIKPR